MKSNIKEEYYKPLIVIVELSNNVVIATSPSDDPAIDPIDDKQNGD